MFLCFINTEQKADNHGFVPSITGSYFYSGIVIQILLFIKK